jgi:hypothetical protein
MTKFDCFQLGVIAGMAITTFLNYCHHRFELPWRDGRRGVNPPTRPDSSQERPRRWSQVRARRGSNPPPPGGKPVPPVGPPPKPQPNGGRFLEPWE